MTITLLGLGVMGGSLARALVGLDGLEVVGWARDASDREAAARAGIPIAADLSTALAGTDLVVLATPLSTLPELANRVAASAPTGAAVTDVASLQAPALAAAARAGLSDRWVSSHPLVGSERSGFDASTRELYAGAPVFLSADGASEAARSAVEAVWARVGAAAEWVDEVKHDARMARVSHLPQVVATALADALAASGLDAEELGPGGRDTTRLAESSPSMWRDLLANADPALVEGLREVARRLEADADALAGGDPTAPIDRLVRANEWRRGS